MTASAEELTIASAPPQVKEVQSERRQQLSTLATTSERQQVVAGSAVQAKAALEAAQQQDAQAEIALRKEGSRLGSFTLYRQELQPFTDKQIALLQLRGPSGHRNGERAPLE